MENNGIELEGDIRFERGPGLTIWSLDQWLFQQKFFHEHWLTTYPKIF